MCELTAPATSPEALFAAVLARDPGRPLLTFYDDATAERAELSAASCANWVAKTHFLLRDELGLGVGDRAVVSLPPHWLVPVVWLGAWSAGLEVVTEDGGQVGFVGPQGAPVDADDVFALALAPWGQGFPGSPPDGTQDFVAAVRPHADAWAQVSFPAGPAEPAYNGVTRTDVVGAATAQAARLGLDRTSRVLLRYTTDDLPSPADLLAPLAAGASLVLVRHADADADVEQDPRLTQENVTHTLG